MTKRGPEPQPAAVKTLREMGAIKFIFPRRRYCNEQVTYVVKAIVPGYYEHFWVSDSGKKSWGPTIRGITDTMLFVTNHAKNWREWEE